MSHECSNSSSQLLIALRLKLQILLLATSPATCASGHLHSSHTALQLPHPTTEPFHRFSLAFEVNHLLLYLLNVYSSSHFKPQLMEPCLMRDNLGVRDSCVTVLSHNTSSSVCNYKFIFMITQQVLLYSTIDSKRSGGMSFNFFFLTTVSTISCTQEFSNLLN